MIASRAAFRSSFVIIVTKLPYFRFSSADGVLSDLESPTHNFCLLVFIIDLADAAGFVEYQIEGLAFFHDDLAELLFLGQHYRLHLYHFENGEERDDHGMAGGAGLEKFD